MTSLGEQTASWNRSLNTVFDEVTSEIVDAEHVRRRVDDWEERLNGLYAAIEDWLPDGWEARQGAPVLMHEKFMRKFGVPAGQLPTLELRGRVGQFARFEPRALWIIGDNGRVNLSLAKQYYYIIDMAENFGKPDWQVSRIERPREREPVTRAWLHRLLR